MWKKNVCKKPYRKLILYIERIILHYVRAPQPWDRSAMGAEQQRRRSRIDFRWIFSSFLVNILRGQKMNGRPFLNAEAPQRMVKMSEGGVREIAYNRNTIKKIPGESEGARVWGSSYKVLFSFFFYYFTWSYNEAARICQSIGWNIEWRMTSLRPSNDNPDS